MPSSGKTVGWLQQDDYLFREMLDGCVILDRAGQILDANPAYCRMSGYSQDELFSLAVADLEPAQPPGPMARFLECMVGGESQRFESQHRRADGRLIDVEVLALLVERPDQPGAAIFCIVRDITEQKQLEAALRRSEQRFSKAFFSNPTACLISDLRTRRFVEVNQAFVELSGFTREEVVGKTALELGVFGETQQRARDRFVEVWKDEGRKTGPLVLACTTRSGEHRSIELHLEAIELEGKECLLATCFDVTSREAAQQRMRAARDELETRVRRRTRMLKQSNALLRQQVEQRRSAEAMVSLQRDLALELSRASSIAEGLARSVEIIARPLSIDGAGIYLRREDGGVTLAAHTGLSERFVQQVSDFGPGSPPALHLQRGEPIYVEGEAHRSQREPSEPFVQEGIRSWAAIPVLHQQQIIGCINVASRDHAELPKSAREFVESVGGQIGGAVARLIAEERLRASEERLRAQSDSLDRTNRQLRSEIEQRTTIQQTLRVQRDVAIALSQARSLEAGIGDAVAVLLDLDEVACTSVYLIDGSGGLTHRFHFGLSQGFAEKMASFEAGSARVQALRREEPLYYDSSRAAFGPDEARLLRAEGLRAVGALPIKHDGTLLGCLVIGSRTVDEFSPNLRQNIEAVVAQVGSAIARLQAEEHLRIKDQAIAASLNAVAICDAEGRVTYVNDAFLRMWGYDREEECLGRPSVDFWSHAQAAAEVGAELSRSGTWMGTIVARQKSGTELEVQAVGTAVGDRHGKLVAMMGSFLDLTWQRRAERLREEAKRLAAAGRMAARIAHEINNPLAGIASCFQLVRQAVPEGHKYTRFADMIEREIDRIGRIVGQMHDLSRPSTNQCEELHVAVAIGEVVTMLDPKLRQHEVSVQVHADGVEGASGAYHPVVRVPVGSVQQVLYNVIANGIEASPPGGLLKIRTACAEKSVKITVDDQGPGIPAAVKSRVFEPFFTTKDGPGNEGLGLGLAISKSIIDSLGGRLVIGQSSDGGASVLIQIPVRPA